MKEKTKNITACVSSLFFVLLPAVTMAQLTIPGGTGLPGEGGTTIYSIIRNIMYWLLALLGFVAVIGFVISGILYLTAAGDETAQERAKRAMIYSITGVIVGLIGLVVIYAVGRLLSATPNI